MPSCNAGDADGGGPVIVDVNGDGFHLTSAEAGVQFDLFGSGKRSGYRNALRRGISLRPYETRPGKEEYNIYRFDIALKTLQKAKTSAAPAATVSLCGKDSDHLVTSEEGAAESKLSWVKPR
jgi:hypothetical protein